MTAISGTATAGAGIQGFGLTGVYGWGESYGVHGSAAGAEDSGVYGTNTNSTGGHGVRGEGYTGVYGNGGLYGVHGIVSGGGAIGVYGEGGEYGVRGDGTFGVYGFGTSYGVYGFGEQFGVHGAVAGSDDRGVFGESAAPDSGYGVYGEGHTGVYGTGETGVEGAGWVGVDGRGEIVGVAGSASIGGDGKGVVGNGTTGVFGLGEETGVEGVVTAGGQGVWGRNESITGGYGVRGTGHTAVYGYGQQYGVHGYVVGDDDRGVFGENTDTSSGYGVYGEGHTGVYGTGDESGVRGEGPTGVYGTGDVSGVEGEALGDGATGVLGRNYLDTGFGTVGCSLSGVGVGAWSVTGPLIEAYFGEYPDGELRFYIDPDGNVYAAGGYYTPLPSPAPDEPDAHRAVSAIQSPEVWVEDFGTASLVDGQAVVSLEPVFASLVNLEAGYHVYLTPLGDCQGLYVADKTADTFEVRELGGGKASISFDYRIVARQAGYEGVRLPEVAIESPAHPEERPSPEGGSHD